MWAVLRGKRSNINRSFNTAEVTGQNYVGGIAGEAKGIIQTCFNSGYILVNGNYGGGIAGKNAVQIEYCYNSGNIESAPVSGGYTGNYKGGIAGLNDLAATIRNSYSIGQLKGVSAGFVAGGLVGINNSTGISNCYYNIETVEGLNAAGQGSQGGENVLGLTTVQMVRHYGFAEHDIHAGHLCFGRRPRHGRRLRAPAERAQPNERGRGQKHRH